MLYNWIVRDIILSLVLASKTKEEEDFLKSFQNPQWVIRFAERIIEVLKSNEFNLKLEDFENCHQLRDISKQLIFFYKSAYLIQKNFEYIGKAFSIFNYNKVKKENEDVKQLALRNNNRKLLFAIQTLLNLEKQILSDLGYNDLDLNKNRSIHFDAFEEELSWIFYAAINMQTGLLTKEKSDEELCKSDICWFNHSELASCVSKIIPRLGYYALALKQKTSLNKEKNKNFESEISLLLDQMDILFDLKACFSLANHLCFALVDKEKINLAETAMRESAALATEKMFQGKFDKNQINNKKYIFLESIKAPASHKINAKRQFEKNALTGGKFILSCRLSWESKVSEIFNKKKSKRLKAYSNILLEYALYKTPNKGAFLAALEVSETPRQCFEVCYKNKIYSFSCGFHKAQCFSLFKKNVLSGSYYNAKITQPFIKLQYNSPLYLDHKVGNAIKKLLVTNLGYSEKQILNLDHLKEWPKKESKILASALKKKKTNYLTKLSNDLKAVSRITNKHILFTYLFFLLEVYKDYNGPLYFSYDFDYRSRCYYKSSVSPQGHSAYRFLFHYGSFSKNELDYEASWLDILNSPQKIGFNEISINLIKTVIETCFFLKDLNIYLFKNLKKNNNLLTNTNNKMPEINFSAITIHGIGEALINLSKHKRSKLKSVEQREDLLKLGYDIFFEIKNYGFQNYIKKYSIKLKDQCEIVQLFILICDASKGSKINRILMKDGTSSFCQHLGIFLGFKNDQAAKACNLSSLENNFSNSDLYLTICEKFKKKMLNHPQYEKEDEINIFPYITRDVVKPQAMTSPYGVTDWEAKNNFKKKLAAQKIFLQFSTNQTILDKSKENLKSSKIHLINENLNKKFWFYFNELRNFIKHDIEVDFLYKNHSEKLVEWHESELQKFGPSYNLSKLEYYPRFEFKDNSYIQLCYFKTKKKRIEIKQESENWRHTFVYSEKTKTLDMKKIKISFRANFIHALDASLLRTLIQTYNRGCIIIHDCVGVSYISLPRFYFCVNSAISDYGFKSKVKESFLKKNNKPTITPKANLFTFY